MKQDEIIDMARQAGLKITLDNEILPSYKGCVSDGYLNLAKLVYAKATAKEQERCCSIIYGLCDSDNVAERTVKAIRGEA